MENKIIDLHFRGYGNPQIAKELGISYSKVRKILKSNTLNTSQSKWTKLNLTTLDEEVLVGTLLGDASVLFKTKLSRYPSFSVAHSIKFEEYSDYKMNLIGESLALKKRYVNHKVKGVTYKSVNLESPNLPCMTIYRESFYPKGKKIVPIDFIQSRFTALSLAILFMDDGTCDKRPNTTYYKIALDGLGYDEVRKFSLFLLNSFNLHTSVHKNGTLAIRSISSDEFVRIIKPYIPNVMKYKLGGHH